MRCDTDVPAALAEMMINSGRQMHGAFMLPQCSTQGIAGEADGGEVLVRQLPLQGLDDPVAEEGLKLHGIHRTEQIAEAVLFGRAPRVSHPMPDVNRKILRFFDHSRRAAMATQRRRDDGRRHGGQRMASSLMSTWISDL